MPPRLTQGRGDDLKGAGAGLYEVGLQAVADADLWDAEGGEDLDGAGPAAGVGDVVVADQEEDGNAVLGKVGHAAGELALVGLGRVAALVGVSGEEDEVNVLTDGVVG